MRVVEDDLGMVGMYDQGMVDVDDLRMVGMNE